MNVMPPLAADDIGSFVLWGYRCSAEGIAERLPDPVRPAELGPHEGWLWLHVSLADTRARQWIASLERLPQRARDILLSDDPHLRLEIVDDLIVGVVADMHRDFDRPGEDIGRLRFVLDDRLLISARRQPLHSVEEARRAMDEGRRLVSAVSLIETIIEKFADAAAGTAERLSDRLDEIEDHIVQDYGYDDRRPLALARRTAVRLHRQLVGLHSLFVRLERFGHDRIPADLRDAAHRLAGRLDTLHHDIQVVQERARLLQDEVSAKAAAESNRLLYLLSVLTAVLVPPTLVTGVFGMNTKGLPFTEDPNGFLYAMALCAGSAAGIYFMMRRLGRPR